MEKHNPEKNEIIESIQIIKDDEIDLLALTKTIWNGRKIIYKSVAVCLLIGLTVAFVSPKKYTASAILLPSAEKKSGSLGGLSALAGMAGINLSSVLGESTGIPPEIFPQVVNSYPFKKDLMLQKYDYKGFDHPITLYDYVIGDTIPTILEQILKYSIRLPWTLKELYSDAKFNGEYVSNSSVVILGKEEIDVVRYLNGLINVDVNHKTNLITISAETNEPILAAQYVQKAVELLQVYLIKYKTKQVRQNFEFIQGRLMEMEIEYKNAQKVFFDYKDKHRNLVFERVDIEYQQLSDNYDIIYGIYKGLAQQLEQARLAVMEETPAFEVLEPPVVPYKKSSLGFMMIMSISLFTGVILGVAFILLRMTVYKFVNNLKAD